MKKYAVLFVALFMSFGLAACGGAETKSDAAPAPVEAAPEATPEATPEAEAEVKPLEKFEGNKMEKAEDDE